MVKMDRRDRGRGKPKDAPMDTPTTDEDVGKGRMEEDASSETRISTVEKELNDLKDDLSEVKALLKTLTEDKRLSRDSALLPGLISRLVAKTPDSGMARLKRCGESDSGSEATS